MGEIMKRRDFVKCIGGTAAATMLPGYQKVLAASHSPRPNIFMIFTDDTPQKDHGCYGNSHVRTPNIDRFASEGMVFNNAYTPAPMCGPSRACLYTGLYPIRNGAHPNHGSVKPNMKSMAHYMKAVGYRVIILGKQHIRPAGYFPFEEYDVKLCLSGPGDDIKRILADPGDKPLCVMMNHFETHWHFNYKPGTHKHDPQGVEIPPYLVDTPETRQMRANYYSEIEYVDQAVKRVLDLLKERNMEENTLTIYASDHGSHWPHEKWNLYDAGIKVPFIARWPGKIEPGSSTDALVSLVDIIPTFIDVAGGNPERVVADCGSEPLDGKSFLPVMLGESAEHHDAIYGVMTYGVITGYPMRAIRTRNYKYIWNIDSHFEYPDYWATNLPATQVEWNIWSSWLRKAGSDPVAAKVVNKNLYRPPDELYDLRSDPHEMNNLAGDPAQKNRLEEMRGRLHVWMQEQGDAGDSAYHMEADQEVRHLDKMWCHQPVVNVHIRPTRPLAFDEEGTISLESPMWRAAIYYTTDGTEPDCNSTLYKKPFNVYPPVVIKARGYDGDIVTPVRTTHFREIGPTLLYKDWHPPKNHN